MLRLPSALRRVIEAHGTEGYPDEICGFLIGRTGGTDGPKIVERIIPIANTWDNGGEAEFANTGGGASFAGASRRRRFKIPPDEYVRADQSARADSQAILGFYHSHPDHPARPSEYDLALAREIFPGYSYIIVSVVNAVPVALTSWVLRDDFSQFDEEIVADTTQFTDKE